MWLVYAFIGLSIIHIVYENIILPSIRLHYKYKLFSLRDKLRLMQHNNTDNTLTDAIYSLQAAVNNMVALLPNIDGYLLFKTREAFIKDPSFKNRVNKRIEKLKLYRSEEIRIIHKSIKNTFKTILLFNSGSLFFYILPVFFAIAFLEKLKSWVSQTIFVPEEEISRIAPAI